MSALKYPTGDGYLNPTIRALLASAGAAGGGTGGTDGGTGGTGGTDLSGYVTTAALTKALAGYATDDELAAVGGVTSTDVQKWIRGNGLFRSVLRTFTNDWTMTDTHWQNFNLVTMGTGNSNITVVKPSTTLVYNTTPFAPVSGGNDRGPPAGIWTLIINPNNTYVVNLVFGSGAEAGSLINGTNSSGVFFGQSNGTVNIPQGRAALLMYVGTETERTYYVNIL